MEELQLTQLVSSLTRITANSSTTIDLIFSSKRNLATSVASTPCDLSDHHIVSCQVNIKASRPIPSFVYSRSFNPLPTIIEIIINPNLIKTFCVGGALKISV